MSGILDKLKHAIVNVETSDLKAKYRGSGKERIMNTIFDRMDALDRYDERYGELSPETLNKVRVDGKVEFIRESNIMINGVQAPAQITDFIYNIRHYLLDGDKISFEKARKIFGDDINIEDIENALNDIINLSETNLEKEASEAHKRVQDKNPDIPEQIREHMSEKDKVKIVEKNGQKYYEVDSDGDGSHFITYNSQGTPVKMQQESEIEIVGQSKHKVKETFLFNEDGSEGKGEWGSYGEKLEYDNGLVEMTDWRTNRMTRTFGKNQFNYKVDTSKGEYEETLENIELNKGLPNETKLSFKRDKNGKITDINFNVDQKDTKISLGDYRDMTIKAPSINMTEKQKQNLIDILNAGATLGDDFELKVNGDKIEINPIIKDKNGNYLENVPNSVRQDVIDLMKKGLHSGSDYDLSVDENGNYKLDYQSQQARDYQGDERIVNYSKDGKTKTVTTTDGNEVTTSTTQNGKTITTKANRGEELLKKLLEGDLNGANELLGDIDYEVNNFDFYQVIDKYQKTTGKNLMQEAIKQFREGKLDGTIIKRLSPTIGWSFYESRYVGRDYITANLDFAQREFDKNITMFNHIKNFNPINSQVANILPNICAKENISADKYTQRINNKNYSVEKNGNIISISCNGDTKTIDVSNLHKSVQKMIFNSNPVALYQIAKKGVKIYTVDDTKATQNGGYSPDDNSITMNAGRVSSTYFQNALVHESGHSVWNPTEFPKNETLYNSFKEEKEAWEKAEDPFKKGNHDYAASSVDEFFAEAYCLITTGNSKSAYTICKYFPKTLAIVKQIVDKS